MSSKIKIPTLLGLGVLLAGLVAGVFLVTTSQLFKTRASVSNTPQEITVTNVSANHVSIYWQTDEATPGFIQAGPTSALGLTFLDDRDLKSPEPHKLHFVTLTGLLPNTTYYYKIISGSDTFPKNDLSKFTTPSEITPSNLQPIIGRIVNINQQPAEEAVAILDLPGAQSLAAITKAAGNFVLPLAEIYNSDLSAGFKFNEASTSAKLVVFDTQENSEISFQLPLGSTLPTIILGQSLDLIPKATPTPSENARYDLNSDGVINSLDLSILLKNFGKNPKEKRADFNEDGVVNQKDVEILNKFIPNTIPQ